MATNMYNIITPEPHLIPGYTGHCPQDRFRAGRTYGRQTHKLLIDPCVNHAPELIVTQVNKIAVDKEKVFANDIKELQERDEYVDVVYRPPIIPGYDGFIPKMPRNFGKRFLVAATAGLAEHTALMKLLHCERRNLVHRDILESGVGVFDPRMCERMMPMAKFRAPLVPVRPRAQAIKLLDCSYKEKKQPYSKFTVPHYMDDDDEDKWIVKGYGGHIPRAMTRFGQTSAELNHNALCDFTAIQHFRRSAEWCPIEKAGVGSACPNSGHFVIYHRNSGLVPNYGGHVPGEHFTFGRTYGNSTVDAKHWLAKHKNEM